MLELLPVKFVIFSKSRLIFGIFYCFWMFENKIFTHLIYACLKTQKVFWCEIFSTLFSLWRQRYWQIFKSISVPSRYALEITQIQNGCRRTCIFVTMNCQMGYRKNFKNYSLVVCLPIAILLPQRIYYPLSHMLSFSRLV